MILFISNLLRLPVTRKEVLQRAKKYQNQTFGLCMAIKYACFDYHLKWDPDIIIPKFTNENALKFGASESNAGRLEYWWKFGVWNTGRLDFLDWLIEEYKDDKTNLRKLHIDKNSI